MQAQAAVAQRFQPRVPLRLPYLSSPRIGKPPNWLCTRIWWVRPVPRRASTRAASPNRSTSVKSVTEALPSRDTRTIRSLPWVIFSRGASMRRSLPLNP